MMTSRSRQRFGFTALVGLLVVMGIALVGETVARLSISSLHKMGHPVLRDGNRDQRSLFQYSRQLGWLPTANIDRSVEFPAARVRVKSNREGFREREWDIEDERRRWVILGDSQVWGYNVEADARFSDILQGLRPEVSFHNYGVSGYGTAQEYLLYLNAVRPRRPFGVILLFGNNDRANNVRKVSASGYARPRFVRSEQGWHLEDTIVPNLDPAGLVLSPYRSHLWDAIRYRWDRVTHGLSSRDPTHAILRKIVEAVRGDGSELIVLIESEDVGVRDLCVEMRVPVLELGSVLESAREYAPVDYPREKGMHWTPWGHATVAEAVSNIMFPEEDAEGPEPALRGIKQSH